MRQAKPGKVVHGSATHPRGDENELWCRCAGAIKVVILIGTQGSRESLTAGYTQESGREVPKCVPDGAVRSIRSRRRRRWSAAPPRLFLIRGHSTFFQREIRCSSRPIARPAGTLAAPVKPAQQAPHLRGVVSHCPLLFDQLRHEQK